MNEKELRSRIQDMIVDMLVDEGGNDSPSAESVLATIDEIMKLVREYAGAERHVTR